MRIRLAEPEDFTSLRDFYNYLADYMQGSRYDIHWRANVYPDSDDLIDAIYNRQLYVGEEDGVLVSAAATNEWFDPVYGEVPWPTIVEPYEVAVIHILGVHPLHRGKGYATEMLQTLIQMIRIKGYRVVRLDVHAANKPALDLYKRYGFRTIATKPQYFGPDPTYFHLMELKL